MSSHPSRDEMLAKQCLIHLSGGRAPQWPRPIAATDSVLNVKFVPRLRRLGSVLKTGSPVQPAPSSTPADRPDGPLDVVLARRGSELLFPDRVMTESCCYQ
jgi:hypothetical protein